MSNFSPPKAVLETALGDEKFDIGRRQVRRILLWVTDRSTCLVGVANKICRIVRHPKPCLRLLWVTESSASLVDVVGANLYVELYVDLYAGLYAATKDVELYVEFFVTHPRL